MFKTISVENMIVWKMIVMFLSLLWMKLGGSRKLSLKMKLDQNLRIPKPFELIKLTYGGNHELSKKTPLEKWCYLYGIGRMFISPIGYTIFEDDQTLHWKSKTTPIICIAYVLLSVHTAFHYIKQGQFVKCLPCTCLLAILLSVCISFARCVTCE